jgi:hypothetical protein
LVPGYGIASDLVSTGLILSENDDYNKIEQADVVGRAREQNLAWFRAKAAQKKNCMKAMSTSSVHNFMRSTNYV